MYLRCTHFFFFRLLFVNKQQKKKKKKGPLETWVKNITSYATIPTLHSPGKGRKPYGKKSQSISQTKHDSGLTQFFILHLLNVVLLHCGCLSLNPFIKFRIWNNSSSPDVLNVQTSISISPKYESKSKTTSHCHLLLHDCTNVAV